MPRASSTGGLSPTNTLDLGSHPRPSRNKHLRVSRRAPQVISQNSGPVFPSHKRELDSATTRQRTETVISTRFRQLVQLNCKANDSQHFGPWYLCIEGNGPRTIALKPDRKRSKS
ncbi:hypothetical protein CABS01_01609 [Colletotrichum abscissum]|uniref:uncharacterized protein n=1 Tax=Colletotrichum abscissum TaxID=1671311 RepID=UPI0027D5B6F9|nr:uncharacterized protein CABS01_01609 [Colletotrichum abscissum]KAK1495802.1 hypothetical protein CABS01_01609 [Colletotrichum abscissum]